MNKYDHRFSAGITQDIAMDCVDAAGQSMTLEAALGYHPTDPYAVTVTFRTTGGTSCGRLLGTCSPVV